MFPGLRLKFMSAMYDCFMYELIFFFISVQ